MHNTDADQKSLAEHLKRVQKQADDNERQLLNERRRFQKQEDFRNALLLIAIGVIIILAILNNQY